MEINQYISKQPTGYWRNQKGNQNDSRNKWQWKHDNLKLTGCHKSSSKREVYSNTILPQETRKTLTDIKEEIDNDTIIVGYFNTPLTPMDRSSKQKINKETQVSTLDEMHLIDIFRTFQPNAEEYTFFSMHMEHSPG